MLIRRFPGSKLNQLFIGSMIITCILVQFLLSDLSTFLIIFQIRKLIIFFSFYFKFLSAQATTCASELPAEPP